MSEPLPQFDALLHQPTRTQIAAFIAARGEATFSELKQALGATDGNLDAHLGRFIEAGYVTARKEPVKKGRPQTIYTLSPIGREALKTYIAQLSALIDLRRHDEQTTSSRVSPA